ncbi:succinate dehydrogenase, cytochrome b556 subunit [Hoeflea sp. Naph1]|uniref:succinate dehydrogenase, cytochrome b556 subunit n=1 Tax=Hoeflea sp. Naph1 TaxID=3388653 RepID=UPI0039903631
MTHPRPKSPNMQNYRPQLTSVMSFGHRLSGVGLSLGAFGLVLWLLAGVAGPDAFSAMHSLILSLPGRVLLFLFTLAFFYHLCNGIRHLVWDSVHGFELRSIYVGGWAVMAASLLLTIALWGWWLV